MKTLLLNLFVFLSVLGYSQTDTVLYMTTGNQDNDGDVYDTVNVSVGEKIIIVNQYTTGGFDLDTNGVVLYNDVTLGIPSSFPKFDTLLGSVSQSRPPYIINKNSKNLYVDVDANWYGWYIEFKVKGSVTGINEITEGKGIGIFPNPVTSDFTIKSDEVIKKVEILNILGEVVKSVVVTGGNEYRVSVSGITGGIYFVRINDSFVNKITITQF